MRRRNLSPAAGVIYAVVSTAIGQAAADREVAFDALVGPLIEPAFKLAYVLLRNPDDAEDVVQEATLKAWRNLDRLRDPSAARPWFFSIVANQSRSLRRSRWWSVIRRDQISRADGHVADPDVQIDLERELRKLPVTDREALFLFFYLDLPLGEVGRTLGISPQAAKSRVHRAVAKLRLGVVEVAE
jgi:RNA polymerase sigma-70 factor, ECF subfamily